MPISDRWKRRLAVALIAVLGTGSRIQSGSPSPVGFDPFAGKAPNAASAPAKPTGNGPVIPEVSFSNNDISMVLQIISDATGWSIFPSTEVSKAKISLWAKNISADRLLETVVTLAGFTHYRQDDLIMIMTYDEYAQYHGLAKEVKSLKYASADAVASVIAPFLSKLGKSQVHRKTNALVLFDTSANLTTIASVIEKLDVPDDADTVLEVIDLTYLDAVSLAETLQKVFSESPTSTTSGPPLGAGPKNVGASGPAERITENPALPSPGTSSPRSGVSVYALDRTNQLIFKAFKGDVDRLRQLVAKLDTYVEPTSKTYHFTYVDAAEIFSGLDQTLGLPTRTGLTGGSGASGRSSGQGGLGSGGGKPCGVRLVTKANSILLIAPPSVHRIMASIVESVDRPSTYEAGIIRVYKIENADVTEVAQAVRDLLERQADRTREKTGEATFKSPTGGEMGEPPRPGTIDVAESDQYIPQIETRIAVSKATNSVIVQATTRQHRELEKLMGELDKRRRQVLIESQIVEVTTADNAELGVELSHAGKNRFAFTQFGLSTNMDPTTGVRKTIVSPGGTVGILAPDSVQAIVAALASNENARISSAPRILVNDNTVGTINSVAEQPYTQVNQGTVTSVTSFGGFAEAGTQFAVTPHISENGYLRVEYQITLNSFAANQPGNSVVPPPRNTSSIRSEATVPSGHTIVVGGLQTSDEQKTVQKVPLLGDIPLVGLVFRHTATSHRHKTIYLFITPSILAAKDFNDLKETSDRTLQEMKMQGGDDRGAAGEVSHEE